MMGYLHGIGIYRLDTLISQNDQILDHKDSKNKHTMCSLHQSTHSEWGTQKVCIQISSIAVAKYMRGPIEFTWELFSWTV